MSLAVRVAAAGTLLTAGLIALTLFAAIGVVGETSRASTPSAGMSCSLSDQGSDEIPPDLMPLYASAAEAYGLGDFGAFVLAAINKVETDFGRNLAVSSAGAVGWMQFMPATWRRYGVDGNGDGRADPTDPRDAIPAAANYLAASGAPARWDRALFAYNRARWYVRKVLSLAASYAAACDPAQTVGPAVPARFAWPVRGPVTSPFGPRTGRFHAGIDIGAPAGTPVTAPQGGVVSAADWQGGYGQIVCLRHAQGLETCHAHLQAILVARGEIVRSGDAIGLVGCTGRCFGAHLHFEVRVTGRGAADPLPYLGH